MSVYQFKLHLGVRRWRKVGFLIGEDHANIPSARVINRDKVRSIVGQRILAGWVGSFPDAKFERYVGFRGCNVIGLGGAGHPGECNKKRCQYTSYKSFHLVLLFVVLSRLQNYEFVAKTQPLPPRDSRARGWV